MTEELDIQLSAESRGIAPGRGRLAGRKILVIGGGQAAHGDDDVPGNGRAASILIGREGATVVVADLKLELAEATAELVRREGVDCFALEADATDEASVLQMLASASELMGGLDGIYINVGIDGGVKLSGTDVATWDRVFDVNARSHFLGVKYGMPMLPAGIGSVVLMSSTSAFSAKGEVPAMSASKASLTALCLHAARENGERQVRCNVIAPGLIDTPLGRSGGRKREARAGIGIPMGRFGTAWETAYLVVFLLSQESAYITGQTIVMDGGRLIP